DGSVGEISGGFFAYKVIFFRDQDITTEDHLAFARRFGELEEHPFIPAKPGYEQIVQFKKNDRIIGVENIWHHDVTWRLRPSLGSVLRALEVPRLGGDTLFADMYAAYDRLSADVKRQIDGASAVHDFPHAFGRVM